MIKHYLTGEKLTPKQAARDAVRWAMATLGDYPGPNAVYFFEKAMTEKEQSEFKRQIENYQRRIQKILGGGE